MRFDTPFFMTKIECPVCRQTNEFENIKAGAYTETERDTDFCPKNILWANEDYQKINPLLYFMATCPNCFYTHEFDQTVRQRKKDCTFSSHRLNSIRQRHTEDSEREGSVINRLGEALDSDGHPFESAVIKLLLGIYDQKITDEPSALDIGRYYLRIAWLYRENQQKRDANHRLDGPDLDSLKRGLRHLRSRFQNHKEEISDLLTSIEARSDPQMGAAESGQKKEHFKIKYLRTLSEIKEDLSSMQEGLDHLIDILAERQDLFFGSEAESINITDGLAPPGSPYLGKGHLTFVDYLSALKEIWPEIPLNELEAMELALKYYKQSYQEVGDGTQENQRIQGAYLIAEISRRVGEFQEAESYFREAERAGEDFIERNQDDPNKIALAIKIVELARKQGELNLVQAKSQVY